VRVLVVGAGAVGSLLGWALAAAGDPVTVVRRAAPAPAAGTIPVIRPDGSRSVADVRVVGSLADVGDEPPEVILLAVRQHDLADVLRDLGSVPDAIVLTAENGIGAEEAVADAWPGRRSLAASLTAAVERAPDGTVTWLRRGGIALAPVRGDVDDAGRRLVSSFGGSGLPARWMSDARSMKWSKLVGNLVANATSALLDVDPAVVYRDRQLFEIERDQLLEALRVMDALHLRVVDLPGASVTQLARAVRLPGPLARLALRGAVARARGGKHPSLRIALALGGQTEVEWLNGAVVRAAAATGLRAPVNAALATLVTEASTDAARRAWFRQRPERLLEAIRSN
jgi:2-dehydropantoate 2-reductase